MLLQYPRQELVAAGVQIRPWRSPDDLACIAAAATDPDIPAGTTVPPVFDAAAGEAFLARQHDRLTNGDGISQAVVDADTDQAVGLMYLDRRPQCWIAGLGYWLVPAARRRHLATPAIRLVTDWALRELEVLRVEAWVAPDNLPSPAGAAARRFPARGTPAQLPAAARSDRGRAGLLTRGRILTGSTVSG